MATQVFTDEELAVALSTLPWLGFVPDTVSAAPPMAVARLADQLGVDPAELRSYGRRAKTRTEHLRLVAKYLGWRLPTTLELQELDEFLLARAALEYMRPGDMLTVQEADRLGRNLLEGLIVLTELFKQGIAVKSAA